MLCFARRAASATHLVFGSSKAACLAYRYEHAWIARMHPYSPSFCTREDHCQRFFPLSVLGSSAPTALLRIGLRLAADISTSYDC